MRDPGKRRVCPAALLAWLLAAIFAGDARAITIYDLDPSGEAVDLPSLITPDSSPVYITNYNQDASDATGSGRVDTLRVGQHSRYGIGFDNIRVAAGRVAVTVAGDADIYGEAAIGHGFPDSDVTGSGLNAALTVAGRLAVHAGGSLTEQGYADATGTDPSRHAAASAGVVDIAGGTVTLNAFSTLTSTGSPTAGTDENSGYAFLVRNGGRLILNGGLPPAPDPATGVIDWVFKGASVTGGLGMWVGDGGVLAGGGNGGVIRGATGQELRIARDGILDASQGHVRVLGMETVAVNGLFRTGYVNGLVTGLTVDSGRVVLNSGAVVTLSRDLARHINQTATDNVVTGAELIRARDIIIAGGANQTVLQTGMGSYTVKRTREADATAASAQDATPNSRIEEEPDEPQTTPFAAAAPAAATGADASTENAATGAENSGGGTGDAGAGAANDGTIGENVHNNGSTGDGAAGDDSGGDGSTGDSPGEPATEPPPEPATPRYDPVPTTSWDRLAIERVDGRVTGDRTTADQETFHRNMDAIWNPGRVGKDFTDTIYNLIAAEEPTIETFGDAGAMNKAVLGAFVDGRGAAIEGHGVADQSVYEFYSGGSQWGVNNVAFTTSTELMHSLNRRVDRIGTEMDRLGESWPDDVYGYSYASLADCPPDRTKRVWGGAWGRNEEADFEYGIAGYRYKPAGALFGYDKTYGGITVGGAFAYGRGDYEDRGADSSSSEITSYSGGLYGSYHAESGLTLSGHAVYSHLQNDLRDRRGGMERIADHSAYSWSVGGRVGYDLFIGDVMTLSPTIGLAKIRAVSNAHDESLGGIGVMRVGDVRRDALLLPLDLSFGFDLKRDADRVLRVTGNIGYAYDFDADGLSGTLTYNGLTGAGGIAVPNRSDGRNRFNLGGGFTYTNEKFDLGARYDFFRAAGHTSHQAHGSLGIKF